jgi:hypothetical protein
MMSTHFAEEYRALARASDLLGHQRYRQPGLAWQGRGQAQEFLVGIGTYVRWTVGVWFAVRKGEVGVAAAAVAAGRRYVTPALGMSVRQSSLALETHGSTGRITQAPKKI